MCRLIEKILLQPGLTIKRVHRVSDTIIHCTNRSVKTKKIKRNEKKYTVGTKS